MTATLRLALAAALLALATLAAPPAVAQEAAPPQPPAPAAATAPAPQKAELEEVAVSAERERGYAPPAAVTSASRTETPLLELPQAVQVVPREVISDQAATTLAEAAQNVSGVVQASYTYYDFLQIRGFANATANYRDGLRVVETSGYDTALVERVEVVKGPASMLYGRIEPGGLVNTVTKRPQATAALSLQQEVGRFGLVRTVADATGPLTADGALAYRLVGAYAQADSFMDFVRSRKILGGAMLAWRPSERFEVNASLELQEHRFADTEDIGIPIVGDRPAAVPRSRYYGDPLNWRNPNDHDRLLVGFDWTWRPAPGWALTQRAHWHKQDQEQLTIFLAGFDGVSTIDRGLWHTFADRDTLAANLDLTGDVRWGGLRHRLLVGADWYRNGTDWHGFSDVTPLVPSVDLLNPTYGIDADAIRALPENFFFADRDQWFGVYAQDQVTLFDRLQVLLGGRFDWARTGNSFDGASLAAARGALALEDDRSFSPRLGALYQVTPEASVYASAARSFGANNGRSASGVPFDPEEGRQVEAGAKWQSAGGALSATAAVFRLEKTNVLTADLSTPEPDDSIAIGKVRTQGLELDLQGQVTRNVSVIASYAFTDSEVVVDAGGLQGNRLANVPRHAGSLWAKFDSAPGGGRGWEAGGGLIARSLREGDLANSFQLPGYAVVNLLLRYRLPLGGTRLAAQVNVENLLDQSYFDRGGFAAAKYGSPRTVIGSISFGR